VGDATPTPDSEPDWSLLPHDPVRFFGLAVDFDRKDLKRSYNRLLRLYKPEKHPAEFQQIRAAYEDLERRLRYGDTRAASGEANWASAEAPVSARPHDDVRDDDRDDERGADGSGSNRKEADSRRARLHGADAVVVEAIDLEALAARLESGGESLSGAYDALAKKQHKTPPDYYALALMGDATRPPEELLLLRWLLKGLESWPGDSALSQLVHGYLRTQAPSEVLPALLVMISKMITNDAFYRLTEGAWERLLRERPFAVFAKTLERCEANIAAGAAGDPAIGGRVAFYLFALRYASWKDTGDWKDRALEFVEEHFDQMPEHLVNDLDGLMIVREYLAHRAEFVAAHPLRARLDAVLEAAYTQDQLEIDRMMVDCQREVLASPEMVAEAFPAADSPACRAFYPLWAWISEDIASRLAPPVEEATDLRLWKGRTIEFLSDTKNAKSWLTRLWTAAAITKGVGYVVGAIVLFFLYFGIVVAIVLSAAEAIYGIARDGAGAAGVLLGIPIALIALRFSNRWLASAIEKRIWDPFSRWIATRNYHQLWRPRAFDFLRRSVLDFFAFRELVAQAAAEAPPDNRSWINHFIQQDFGLAVYSIAQRFRE
jgi:hypothetical protein